MSFKREKNQPDEKTSRNAGNFRLDGSWNSSASLKERGPLYAFVMDLARLRRISKASPAQFADNIAASKWAQAFGELEQWRTLTGFHEWPFAWTRTSADETVKRAGIGAVESSHWEAGNYVAGEDERPFVSVDGEKIASFVASLGSKLSMPQDADQAGVATHTPGHSANCTCETCFAASWEAAGRAVGGQGG